MVRRRAFVRRKQYPIPYETIGTSAMKGHLVNSRKVACLDEFDRAQWLYYFDGLGSVTVFFDSLADDMGESYVGQFDYAYGLCKVESYDAQFNFVLCLCAVESFAGTPIGCTVVFYDGKTGYASDLVVVESFAGTPIGCIDAGSNEYERLGDGTTTHPGVSRLSSLVYYAKSLHHFDGLGPVLARSQGGVS